MTRKLLLICGVASSLLYVAADLLGGVAWPEYSHAAQGVSELMSPGTPSRTLVLSLMTVRSLLLLALAGGLWRAARGELALRLAAVMLTADVVVGQVTASVFPAPQRGAAESAAMHMHVIGTAVESFFIMLTMAFAAAAFGKRFRIYSVGTIVILLVFGGLAGFEIQRLEAQLPTPWLGVAERINIYAYLLWIAVLAIMPWRESAADRGAASRMGKP